ncbi:MAG: glycosyltransferase family A protein [Gemmataceae bacterium]
MPPTVSVVIPLYNAAAYIGDAVRGVAAQTFPDWELIVVDDGSNDDSAAAAERAARSHSIPADRFTLIRKPNGGEPSARNAGIAVARGEWVANTDADDWWEPTKLEKQLAAAAAAGPDCVLVHTGVTHHEPDGSEVKLDMAGTARRVGRCTDALLEPHSCCHPSILVRKSALDRIGGYDPEFKRRATSTCTRPRPSARRRPRAPDPLPSPPGATEQVGSRSVTTTGGPQVLRRPPGPPRADRPERVESPGRARRGQAGQPVLAANRQPSATCCGSPTNSG